MRPDHGQDPNVWEASTANILMFSELVNWCSEKATQLFDTWSQGSELDFNKNSHKQYIAIQFRYIQIGIHWTNGAKLLQSSGLFLSKCISHSSSPALSEDGALNSQTLSL
jgi:hypothetical protein